VKIPKLKKYDIVRVTWIDSYTIDNGAWIDEEEIDSSGDGHIETVGHYLEKSQTQLILCQSYYRGQDVVQGGFSIPLGCIKEIEKL